jgi:exopolysaccharide biosynthesis polyprenyl glycosylphosphotransferase
VADSRRIATVQSHRGRRAEVRTVAMASQIDGLTAFQPPEFEAVGVDGYAAALAARRRETIGLRWIVLELLLAVAALTVAVLFAPDRAHTWPWLVCFGAFILLFDLFVIASRRSLGVDVFNVARDSLFVGSLAAIATLMLRVLVADDATTASQTVTVWAYATTALFAGRVALSRVQLRERRAGKDAKATLIVGAGKIGQLTAKRLLEHPELGLRPVGFLDKEPLQLTASTNGLRVVGASWDFDEVVSRYGVEAVILGFSTAPHDVLLRIVRRCQERGIAVRVVPRLFENVTARLTVDYVGGLPLVSIHPANPKGWRFRAKYMIERAAAAILLVILLPILAATALAVWISLGRPIVYRQRRVGLDRHEFEMLKFRSMRSSPDEEGVTSLLPDTAPGGVGTIERRTRVGKLIRRTSIDELPQLINVLRGDMCLVGPRPERPEFAQIFDREIYRYGERLRVKSGITGLAQVHGLRGPTSLSDRVELDNHYIENWSFWLDVKILLLTIRSVLQFNGG